VLARLGLVPASNSVRAVFGSWSCNGCLSLRRGSTTHESQSATGILGLAHLASQPNRSRSRRNNHRYQLVPRYQSLCRADPLGSPGDEIPRRLRRRNIRATRFSRMALRTSQPQCPKGGRCHRVGCLRNRRGSRHQPDDRCHRAPRSSLCRAFGHRDTCYPFARSLISVRPRSDCRSSNRRTVDHRPLHNKVSPSHCHRRECALTSRCLCARLRRGALPK